LPADPTSRAATRCTKLNRGEGSDRFTVQNKRVTIFGNQRSLRQAKVPFAYTYFKNRTVPNGLQDQRDCVSRLRPLTMSRWGSIAQNARRQESRLEHTAFLAGAARLFITIYFVVCRASEMKRASRVQFGSLQSFEVYEGTHGTDSSLLRDLHVPETRFVIESSTNRCLHSRLPVLAALGGLMWLYDRRYETFLGRGRAHITSIGCPHHANHGNLN